jgi:site-specific recombinase XerD
MALERVWERAAWVDRIRDRPFGKIVDGFCQWLLDRGYARGTVRARTQAVRHLDNYITQRGDAAPEPLGSDLIAAFLKNRLGGKARCDAPCAIRCLTKYLRAAGLLHVTSASPPYQVILDKYLIWMRDYCHCSERTAELRSRYLIPFLKHLGPAGIAPAQLARLSPHTLERYILDYARNTGDSTPAHVATALRTFCHFCWDRRYISRDLAFAVPSFRRYTLSSIPNGITDEQAQKALRGVNRRTVTGRRDYAILVLLYTYGVRGEQVRALRLGDILWAAGQIRFAALKRGKTVIQPLTDEAGSSVLAYLQEGRPLSPHQEVFLTARAPYTPLAGRSLSRIAHERLQNAGIHVSRSGAQVFRHGLATRMLAAGYRLKEIADMLGHRRIQTTAIYAKVDFRALEQVALEWPEGEE